MATHKQEALDAVLAEITVRPARTVGRVVGGLATSAAIGAGTGFFAGHEQLVTLPVTTGATTAVILPNPDTLAMALVNGHLSLATVTMTHTINQPVLAVTSGATLVGQASAAGGDLQLSNEKKPGDKTDAGKELIKLSSISSALFGKRPILSDTSTTPHVALNR